MHVYVFFASFELYMHINEWLMGELHDNMYVWWIQDMFNGSLSRNIDLDWYYSKIMLIVVNLHDESPLMVDFV